MTRHEVFIILVVLLFVGPVTSFDEHCGDAGVASVTGSLLTNWCVESGFNSSSFSADPEARTYDGVEYMSFTGIQNSYSTPHLYFAKRNPLTDNCWTVIQATFDDFVNSTLQVANEVSSFLFFLQNQTQFIVLYYNQHRRKPDELFNSETFSVRAKIGYLSNGIPVFDTEILTGQDKNTFVIWANSNSTDLPYAIQPSLSNSADLSSGCDPTTEMSVFHINSTDTYYMSLGCISSYTNSTSYDFEIRLLSSTSPFFLNFTGPSVLLNKKNWNCDPEISSWPYGFQGGSILHFNSTFYFSVSPLLLDGNTYEGCVLYTFKDDNDLMAGLNLDKIVGSVAYKFPHSGSCSGGAGSTDIADKEVNDNIYYFYNMRSQPTVPDGAYQVYVTTLSNSLFVLNQTQNNGSVDDGSNQDGSNQDGSNDSDTGSMFCAWFKSWIDILNENVL